MTPRLDIVSGDPVPAPPPRQTDAPAGSVLARLRERAAAQRRDQTLDVPVGGIWGTMLIIRYRMPSQEDTDRLLAGVGDVGPSGVPARVSQVSIDIMASCCVTVLGAGDDGLEDLGARLTGRLLTMLDLPLPEGVEDPQETTAGEVIGTLFAGNWVAINTHAGQVMGWMQTGGDEVPEAKGAN